jgi:3',5'-cyclic AMP phosphodiesterase CpdA
MANGSLILQLTDPHIGATWTDSEPAAGLATAVEAVLGLDLRPDAILLSGDLAEHAADSEYELVRELTAAIPAPLYPVAGNHDDRDALRRQFGVPGAAGEPIQYAVDLGPLRLVVLDSTVPGEPHGALDPARLVWLDTELRAAPETPTLLAMHHPPFVSGLPAMDAIGLSAGDRDALRRVLEPHPQVGCIASGHLHRTIAGELGGRPVLVAPSTYAELRLDLRSERLRFEAAPGGFAVHALVDGRLVSHVHLSRSAGSSAR